MQEKLKYYLRFLIILLLASNLTLVGCNGLPANSTTAGETTSPQEIAQENIENMNLPQLAGTAKIELIVNGSPILIEVNGNDAPITAGNFVDLVDRGVYNGLVFHRVVKEPQPFVAQGGDPQGKDPNFPVDRLGTGSFIDPATSEPRYIPLEIKAQGANEPTYNKTIKATPVLNHTRGAVAMARSQMPNSASSQFYIALADLGFLDGNYAVYGYVLEGLNVVDNIQQGDRIESAKIIEGLENLQK